MIVFIQNSMIGFAIQKWLCSNVNDCVRGQNTKDFERNTIIYITTQSFSDCEHNHWILHKHNHFRLNTIIGHCTNIGWLLLVVRALAWVSTIRIWRLIQTLARFGRTGLPRVSGPDNFGINDLLTRDSCELSEIRPQIQNMHKRLGHMGLFGVGPGNFGSSYGWVFVSRPGWTGAGIRNSGPVRGSGIPNRTLT